MSPALVGVICPYCSAPLPGDPSAASALQGCPGCSRELRVATFPRIPSPAATAAPDSRTDSEPSVSCFYHSRNHATVPCDCCGRFICSLCDVPSAGQHFCPNCFTRAIETNTSAPLQFRRLRFDRVAWYLVLLPWITGGVTALITAPIVVWLALTKRKALPSRVAASSAHLLFAAWVALLEFCAVIAVGLYLAGAFPH